MTVFPIPPIWIEWRHHLLSVAAARRLIREIARVMARFYGDLLIPPMQLFRRDRHPIIPFGAIQVLQGQCEGAGILEGIRRSLASACKACDVEEHVVLAQALRLMSCPNQPRRMLYSVLLHQLARRLDLAEDAVRDAAQSQMRHCEAFAFANNDLVHKRKTSFHASSLYRRRKAAIGTWQLELCLWLNRGGCLPLSPVAVKETIIGVRIGIVTSSWGRNHEILEGLLKCEPDCEVNHDKGRQLWTHMKVFDNNLETKNGQSGVCASGGWEFLVDCQREEATDMLREHKPGTFLLRPHPDDHGVFTLSFKTNLSPSSPDGDSSTKQNTTTMDKSDNEDSDESSNQDSLVVDFPTKKHDQPPGETAPSTKAPDAQPESPDSVQHAIVRLSDAGFRCGSFGPFPSLMKLLETVSASLPFELLFHEPPAQGIIKDQGNQPSPNAFLLRNIALHAKSEYYKYHGKHLSPADCVDDPVCAAGLKASDEKSGADNAIKRRFGMFAQLLVLTVIRSQLAALAAGDEDADDSANDLRFRRDAVEMGRYVEGDDAYDEEQDQMMSGASRMIRPFLDWCRAMEILIVPEIAPAIFSVLPAASEPVAVACSDTAIEAAPSGSSIDGGDAVIRRMIQPGSGVEFRTLRVGEIGHSAIVVMFSKDEAIQWLVKFGAENDSAQAEARLEQMEKRRVIEAVDLHKLLEDDHSNPQKRYRFVDPWEVEPLESREAGNMGATLGREHLMTFNLGNVARACEKTLRSVSGVHLLSIWNTAKGGTYLTKAIASLHPPWERDVGVDLPIQNKKVAEPSPITNSIRKHLYRNKLFRRLAVPQRFVALLQIELLDLKNLTSPGNAPPLTSYALLRLKRAGSRSPLTYKAKSLDTASTRPRKIGKTSGPHAPASWGSVVRFRFPLPEEVNCDGTSFDTDREALFRGPPTVLQLSVYEKKFMSDTLLGSADIKLDGLTCADQLEEWVPLRSGKNGITWFARVRMILRFQLLCLDTEDLDSHVTHYGELSDRCPSVAIRKILEYSRHGGAHEDNKFNKKSVSTPDFYSMFESMSAM